MTNLCRYVSLAQITGASSGIIIYTKGEYAGDIYWGTDWTLTGGLPVTYKDVTYSAINPVTGIEYVGTVNFLEEINKYAPFNIKWGNPEEFDVIVYDANEYSTREKFVIQLFDGSIAIALA